MRWAVLLLLSAAPATAQTSLDCSAMRTQVELTDCARQGAEIADAELNRLWSIAKPRADAQGIGAELLNQQRAWLVYRDTTCEFERDQYAGGSIAPMVYYQCIDRMTLWRNAELGAGL